MQKKPAPKKDAVIDAIMIVMYSLMFPIMHLLQGRVPTQFYELLAGVMLGGVAGLANVLLKDGFVACRQGGFSNIEPNATLRFMVLVLVYPALAVVYGLIWLIGWEGPNIGAIFGIGALAGERLMNLRGTSALKRKRDRADVLLQEAAP